MPPQDQRAGVGLVVADTGLDQLMSSRSGGVIHGDDVTHVALGVGEQRLDLIVGWQAGLQERLGVEPDAFTLANGLNPCGSQPMLTPLLNIARTVVECFLT